MPHSSCFAICDGNRRSERDSGGVRLYFKEKLRSQMDPLVTFALIHQSHLKDANIANAAGIACEMQRFLGLHHTTSGSLSLFLQVLE